MLNISNKALNKRASEVYREKTLIERFKSQFRVVVSSFRRRNLALLTDDEVRAFDEHYTRSCC